MVDDVVLESYRDFFHSTLHWGYGEEAYTLGHRGDLTLVLTYQVTLLQLFGARVLRGFELVREACSDGESGGEACARHLAGAVFNQEKLHHRAVVLAVEGAVVWPSDHEHTCFPSLGSSTVILRQHWAGVTAATNRTRLELARLRPKAPELVLGLVARLMAALVERIELLRWHLTYYLLGLVLSVSSRRQCHIWGAGEPISLRFHEYCCSSAEVLASVAASVRLQEAGNATVVEVGVETGETSQRLYELLPASVRLVGVDPFGYQTPRSELSMEELRQRELLKDRYDQQWLGTLVRRVEKMYLHAQPPGRMRLLKMASAEGASCCFEQGANMVFIDADHSYVSVQKDIEMWRAVVARRVAGPQVLSGHDFTAMFPGVIVAVLGFAREAGGSGRALTVNIGTNAVWWITLLEIAK